MSEIRSFKVPGGRLYMVPEYEKYDVFDWYEGYQQYVHRGTTVYEVYTELLVPDGTWVMERPSYGCTWLLGVEWDEIRQAKIDKRWLQERTLLMADRPFAFIESPESYWVPGTDIQAPKSWQKLSYARQIHKGEVSTWGIGIPRIKFAREHADLARKMHDFERNRDRRRNPHRWARLSDVVTATKLRRHEHLFDLYWPFVGDSYYVEPDVTDINIEVCTGANHAEISSQLTKPREMSRDQLQKLIDEIGIDNVWIRAGLANTFLRLRAFRYDPNTMFASPAPVQA